MQLGMQMEVGLNEVGMDVGVGVHFYDYSFLYEHV